MFLHSVLIPPEGEPPVNDAGIEEALRLGFFPAANSRLF
jgi:hypothetical protein